MKTAIFKVLMFTLPCLMMAEDDTRVPVGSRTKKGESSVAMPNEGIEGSSGFIWDQYPPVYLPINAHWLNAVSALGDTVELEDGSVWKVSSYDSYKVRNWYTRDPDYNHPNRTMMITQNTSWFSRYTYRIVNTTFGDSIEVNLFLGPFKEGAYARSIAGFDPAGLVVLTDHTSWEISLYDRRTFLDWALGDTIILGYNSGWDPSCDTILINVTTNNFVRAKQKS